MDGSGRMRMRMRMSAHERGSSASAQCQTRGRRRPRCWTDCAPSGVRVGRREGARRTPVSIVQHEDSEHLQVGASNGRTAALAVATSIPSSASNSRPWSGCTAPPPLLLPDAARPQAAGMILSARTPSPDERISAGRRNTTGALRGTTSTWDSDFPSRLSRRSSRARVHNPPSGVTPHSHRTRAAVRVCSTSRAPGPWTCMLSPLDSEMREASQRAGRAAGAIVSDSQPLAARPSNSRAAAELDVGRIEAERPAAQRSAPRCACAYISAWH
ncbi:hypothetical protein C8Q76DRAFT_197225 [Earliella scabrosa]|nr:hypothetical protein C8Q76DRAFT_197225 [Earliella scabrosa]